ncbi:hypothetical protein Lesp02_37960 [Lentzea sp. NBRC 105346]|nr:hypothetical protein Lesp02_37960 [Lentzea sp. NBRC 105346]
MVSGCAKRPPERWFAAEETTTTTPSGPEARLLAPGSTAPTSTSTRPAPKLETFVLGTSVLAADGLETRESAGRTDDKLVNLCGRPVDEAEPGHYRVVVKSASGASRLEQEIASTPGHGGLAAVRHASCPGAEKMTLSADDQVGWCQPTTGGRAACNVLVGDNEVVVSLKLETISLARATEVITRLAAATRAQ